MLSEDSQSWWILSNNVVVNPSGVDQSTPPPAVVQVLKRCSPFAYAIEALCLGEYPGMEFERQSGWFGRIRDLPRMGGLVRLLFVSRLLLRRTKENITDPRGCFLFAIVAGHGSKW